MKRLLLIFAILLFVGSAEAATKYVKTSCTNGITTYNPTGSGGAGSCTGGSATVYNSIHNGVLALAAGDTLLIRAGTYTVRIDTRVGQSEAAMASGTSGNPITIKAYSPTGATCSTVGTVGPAGDCETVIINGGGSAEAVIQTQLTQWLVFDGLMIDASNDLRASVPNSNTIWKNSVLCCGNYNVTVSGQGGFGAFVGYDKTNVQIINSKIYNNGVNSSSPFGFYGMGFYWQGYDGVLDGNEIYNNGSYGIQIYCNAGAGECGSSGGTGASGNIMRNNYFHNNGSQQGGGTGGATVNHLSIRAVVNQIYNNVFANNTGDGLQIGSNGSAAQDAFYNNTFSNNSNGGIQTNTANPTIQNNLFQANGTAVVTFGGTPSYTTNMCAASGTGCNLVRTAGQIALNTTTFKLGVGSSAINAGTLGAFCPTSDREGDQRPQDGACDIGADEFFGGIAPSTTIAVTGITSPGTFLHTGVTATTTAGTVDLNGTNQCPGISNDVQWTNTTNSTSGTASGGTGSGARTWTATGITLTANRVNTINFTVNCSDKTTAGTTILVRANGADALVGEWGFNENTGSTAVDTSGNSFTATFAGSGNTWKQGKYGAAVELDGNGWLTVPHNNKMDLSLVTLEAWVMPIAPLSVFKAIVTSDDSSAYTYFLYATSEGYCGNGTPMGGIYAVNTGQYSTACSSSVITPNTWHHIAVTHDGINTKFYLDGNLEQTTPSYGLPLEWAGTNLLIGKSPFGELFVGRIDGLRIYNYARSQAQIQTDMATAIGTPPPGSPANLTMGADANIIFGANADITIGAQ